MEFSSIWKRSVPILPLVILVCIFTSNRGIEASQYCATLYEEVNFVGQNSAVGNGNQFLDLENEYTGPNESWSRTRSFKVKSGCLLTACNESYFDGHCQEFGENMPVLPSALQTLNSVNCTCAKDCKCSDIKISRSSCARVYLMNGCNSCNQPYIELKGSNIYFPEKFQNQAASVVVRPGCTLTVYDEEDYEGNIITIEGIVETLGSRKDRIASYECSCNVSSNEIFNKEPRNISLPSWINVPQTVHQIVELIGDSTGTARHPALDAALRSLRNNRSPRNAYILILGSVGSGKSSTLKMLFRDVNWTQFGSYMSASPSIKEYRIPVPVDELGIANSELRIIDTPGLGDTRGLEQDAKLLATLDEFLANHEELRDRLPNVVLIFHRFHDNRFLGQGSNFVKMLRALDSFRTRIVDSRYSNVVFVLTHFASETKATRRRPNEKLAAFKRVIEDYSQFPKPIVLALAENRADDQELPMVNGNFLLPNGDHFPKNIFDKIQHLTSISGDPIGEAIIRAASRDSSEFNISTTNTPIVDEGHPKILNYLKLLMDWCFASTPVSELLENAYNSLGSELRRRFSASFLQLQKVLMIRNITTKRDIPITTWEIVNLFKNIQINEATLYVLEKGLGIKPQRFVEDTITGYSYNIPRDMPMPISPLKFGQFKISDTGFTLPDVISCLLKREETVDLFNVFDTKDDYLQNRLQSLNVSTQIPSKSFTNVVRPGFNINGGSFSSMTVMREYRNFKLVLNDKPKLTSEFEKTIKSLTPFNPANHQSVENWKFLFDEYGTHVVQSAFGGGAIEIQVSSDTPIGPATIQSLYDVLNVAENGSPRVTTNISVKTVGVQYTFKFHGGNPAFHTTDLTDMSMDVAQKLLHDWKESLHLNPSMLKSEIRLLSLGELAKQVGQNISTEIERVTELFFSSALKCEMVVAGSRVSPVQDPARTRTVLSLNELFTKMMEQSRKTDERFQELMQQLEVERKLNEERREAERREQIARDKMQQELLARSADRFLQILQRERSG